jgi:hypothetical protein
MVEKDTGYNSPEQGGRPETPPIGVGHPWAQVPDILHRQQ